MRFTTLVALAAIVSTVACGGGSSGSDATTAPTVKANVTYQGVFSSGVERGTITLTSGSPATGSLKVGSASAVSLSGTFSSATSSFSLSGGGYAVAAEAGTSGTITGTVTGSGITGSGMLAALDATTAATPARYCGVYTGDDAGMVEFYFLGSTAVAVVNGMGGGFSMNGTTSGTSATVSATGKEPGTGKTNTVTASVSFNGTTLTGSGSSTLYPTEKVNITASVAACGGSAAVNNTPASTYIGYAANNGYTGLLSISTGSPASASVAWNNGAAVALSGTYNATTGAVSLTGGGISLTGTAGAASFSGTLTGLSVGATTASVAAMASPASAPVTRYCGGVSGGITGKMIVMQSDVSMSGIFVFGNSSLAVGGTASGGLAYLTAGTTAYFAGSGGSSGYSGTYSHSTAGSGSWSLSGC